MNFEFMTTIALGLQGWSRFRRGVCLGLGLMLCSVANLSAQEGGSNDGDSMLDEEWGDVSLGDDNSMVEFASEDDGEVIPEGIGSVAVRFSTPRPLKSFPV